MADRPMIPELMSADVYELPRELTLTGASGDEIRTISTKEDAKAVITHLRLLKKEIQIQKRELTLEIQSIRAGHRTSMANRPPVRGRGGLMRVIRTVDQVSKDRARSNVANSVAPLEREKQVRDAEIQIIDQTILALQTFALRAPSEKAQNKPARSAKHCPHCGHKLRPSDKFCQDCGGKL